jgi:hypothetical protein
MADHLSEETDRQVAQQVRLAPSKKGEDTKKAEAESLAG